MVQLDPAALKLVEDAVRKDQNKEKDAEPQAGTDAFNPAEYQISDDMAHLYARARWEEYNGEMALVAPATDYMSVGRPWSGRGFYGDSGAPLSKGQEHLRGTARGLADLITQIENGPEGWRLYGVYANGAGYGEALFRRMQKLVLKTPERIDAKAPQAVDPELEARAAAWEGKLTEPE